MRQDPAAELVRVATRRMLRLVPLDAPTPGTVAAADLQTSLADARAALTLALGQAPDVDGCALPVAAR